MENKSSLKKHLFWVTKGCIGLLDKFIDLIAVLLLLLMFSYGMFSIWDNQKILLNGQSSEYQTFKPETSNAPSLSELQKKNPDVFAWLNVYGTQIDYPVLQSGDNEKYLNTDVLGNYKMSGSIFMDYRNKKDFSDFNSIIYGHHMAESAMFGDLDKFKDQKFFKEHAFGNLYFQGKDHGVKFFAFLNVDAFDAQIYQTPVTGRENSQRYLDAVKEKSQSYRELNVRPEDRLVLLSTCSTDATNGRYVLVGVITDKKIAIPKELQTKTQQNTFTGKAVNYLRSFRLKSQKSLLLFILLFLVLLFWYVMLITQRKKREKGGKYENKTN